MKINLSEEHKEKILNLIDRYKDISKNYKIYNDKIKSLQEELDEIKSKLQSTENNLQSIRDEEKIYMDELHKIYGDFTLNDLSQTLFESIY